MSDGREEAAVLIGRNPELAEAGKLSAALGFFGVTATQLGIEQLLARSEINPCRSKVRLLCSATTFLELVDTLQQTDDGRAFWQQNVHSVFVHSPGDPAACAALVRRIVHGAQASVAQLGTSIEWTVSDKLPEFCKSMTGVQAVTAVDAAPLPWVLDDCPPSTTRIIFSGDGGTGLGRFDHHGIPVFVATAGILDIRAALASRDFDLRLHFLSAVPIVLYARWAFAQSCWRASKTSACLVIDDPLLKPRYGFVDFKLLRELMRTHRFTTSIAFIPWNWRRSATEVVRLFNENLEAFSLSIHGCDHTGGEFGIQDRERLVFRATTAMERMGRHQSQTGIGHDPVMVFPQGVFSGVAMNVLKRTGFIGAVNSEVLSTDLQPGGLTVADVWSPGVVKYSDFPIFTRRYPSSGLANFAFDILLGKPCIVVVHHNDCHDRCRPLMEFIDGLNGLHAELTWQSLGEVVRNSFRQREVSQDCVEIEMYGSEMRVGNPSVQRKRLRIRKREHDPSIIEGIRAGDQQMEWTAAENHISIAVDLEAGEEQTIRIEYAAAPEGGFRGESARYHVKSMVRRYLSELRDNYVTRRPFSA